MDPSHPARHPARTGALACALSLGLLAGGLSAQEYYGDEGGAPRYDEEISTRLWFDVGDEPMVERGDRVRIYYRSSHDAYVAIFNIDTNGTVRLVHPRSPEENNWIRGGRDYRLLFPRSPYWYVDDHPGMGYYFVVASPEPFDLSGLDYSYYDGGWDLTRVGRTVYSDPYVAMDDYVAALIPDWEYAPYGLDFATYHVGQERYDYPRFMCYDCHGFRPYTTWNPYHYNCTSFRVVVYDDPWYYPSYRYRGTRVVYADYPYADIPRVRLPRYEFKERADGEPGRPIVATRAVAGTTPGVGGDPAPRRGPAGIGSGGERRSDGPGTGRPGADDPSAGRPGIPDGVGQPRRGDAPVVGRPSGSGAVRTDPTSSRPGGAFPGRERAEPDPPVGDRKRPSAGKTSTDSRFVPVLPPRGSEGPERTRPVLERRTPTTSGEETGRGGAAGGSEAPRERPSAVVRPPTRGDGGGATRPSPTGVRPTAGSRGGSASPPARPPAVRPGGGASRPTAQPGSRGGSSAAPARPPVVGRPPSGGASAGSARPSGPTRPPVVKPRGGGAGGSGSVGRARSGGAGAPGRPPVRVRPRSGGSGGGAPARVRPRTGSGGGSTGGARPPARVKPRGGSSGGGAARGSRPPVRVKPRGGGGGGDDGGAGILL